MTTSTITIQQTNFELTNISDVVVTDTAQDPSVGDYVRDIRVYGTAEADATAAPLLMQLRIRASTRDALNLTAPIQRF